MIQIGDKIKVQVPEKDDCYLILSKFNEKKMTVSKIKRLKNGIYVELEGAESPFGLPYAFLPENIQEI